MRSPSFPAGRREPRIAAEVWSWGSWRSQRLCELLGGRPAALPLDHELPTRGPNIATAAFTYRHQHAAVGQDRRELVDPFVRWPFKGNARRGVQRNEVDLALDAAQQNGQPARVLRRVVHTLKHHVFKGDSATL